MKLKKQLYLVGLSIFLLLSCEASRTLSDKTSLLDQSEIYKMLPGKEISNLDIKYSKKKTEINPLIYILSTPDIRGCGSDLPNRISGLISGTKYFYYKFDVNTKAEAAAMGFSGSFDSKDIVIIRDFVRYKKITCDGKTRNVGIGLRCFIQIKSYKAKLGGSLSGIAASVERGQAEASFSIESLGFPIEGRDLAGIVTQGDYDVDNFAGLAILHSRILETLNSDSTMEIDPVDLPLDKAQASPF